MVSLHDIRQEIVAWGAQHPGHNPFDAIRKKKLAALKALTGRPIAIYAADFLTPKAQVVEIQGQIMIGLRDKDDLPGITNEIPGKSVDLLIQSPGGIAEATETLVSHLRSRFDDIRILVPGTAKSAATMLAMCANEIVMDDLSELGPTDPQMPLNGRYSPAGSILKQFELAQKSLKADPSNMPAWLPVLQMYGPSLLIECRHHLDLSRELVGSWLEKYMFAGQSDGIQRARAIADWLAEDDHFLSHSRRISVAHLRSNGVKVLDMNTHPPLQEAIRALYYAILVTFEGTGTFKLFENSEGQVVAHSLMVQVVSPIPQSVPQTIQPG